MKDLDRDLSMIGTPPMCASSLNKPSSQEGPVVYVIPGDDNAREDGSIDAMAWQEGEFSRPLYAAPHPSFNDAIEAAANRLVEIASLVERRQMLQPRSIARELRKLSRSLKLPDYRGGEAVSERNSTQKDGSR